MPSGKRETERKGNAPVNTGPSPNSDGRVNNPVEEADEPARGSGPLQYFIQQANAETQLRTDTGDVETTVIMFLRVLL
ncbi:hypothetical protein T07_11308 [Trichinella nelsoni]|uniref:Uncharacterized protein n=1 Tax=Trichinella nelsoni TaxID=6336 RepID=A0A0V0RE60_9BILA|nr:hypothetical protein T07_11308 [Trichinella nelsoni]